MTTRGLRHIQMRENAVREQVQQGLITVEHIGRKQNLADPFTKEEKDTEHFLCCRDLLVTKAPSSTHTFFSDIHPPPHDTHSDKTQTKNIISTDSLANANGHIPLKNHSIIRDVADVSNSASSMCQLRQARGVLLYVHNSMLGQIL